MIVLSQSTNTMSYLCDWHSLTSSYPEYFVNDTYNITSVVKDKQISFLDHPLYHLLQAECCLLKFSCTSCSITSEFSWVVIEKSEIGYLSSFIKKSELLLPFLFLYWY
ncbi:hypothetical protein RO3G_07293 [Rhizopus delemar RA 99-880]|uniref:Uncharacterized protein n=1 Tax=Rhizopus delemar (strain RA 99-880 / ATCC MYA-4621 / FGSC 9543 / NRRL 43880) TaxID=246409 RepID=I1C2A8_RHIO9|nr:hypothetical protein RO3G_07293 [Rhizopus delemar RA 99-880]|eukprot:EIE82588.1 hypothetical protein RO3G_07293 [Rhizopus delemar RA 99-880]